MKQAKNGFFQFSGILLFVGGAASIVTGVLIMLRFFADPEISRFFTVVNTLLVFAFAIIAIITAIQSLQLNAAAQRGMRMREAAKKLLSLLRKTIVVEILCLIELLLLCIFGVPVWQILMMLVSGILFPLLFLIAAVKIKRGPLR